MRSAVHVVAGQQDCGAGAAVVFGDKTPDARLHGDVETNRRLVEKQHPGEQIRQLVQRLLVAVLRQLENLLQDAHRVSRRNVPDQLRTIAHHQSDRIQQLAVLVRWCHPEDADFARRWI
jgi:hypothetical protein